MSIDNIEILNFARDTARQAGEYILSYMGKVHDIQFKGCIDLVTEADRKSEEIITTLIKEKYPDHGIMAEEGTSRNKSSRWQWIIDPIDGTTNYAHSYPVFSVSVACHLDEKPFIGVVYDPSRDELFSALLGEGAKLNDNAISVSSTSELAVAMLSTGFPYEHDNPYGDNIDHFRRFIRCSQAVRRGGSAALDMCYVACGRLDGFWEFNLKPWDTAAGCIILTEAGGKLSRLDASEYSPFYPELVASNTILHEQILEVLHTQDKHTV